MWNATYTQSGANVTATNVSYDTTISPGAAVTIGLTGTFTNSNAAPTGFAMNGSACS